MTGTYPRTVAMDELHITYRRSGGFAGIDMLAECLGADLPEDQAQVAADLLGVADDGRATGGTAADAQVPDETGDDAAPPRSGQAPGADQFTYTVRVVRGARSRTLTWADTTVPEEARPLLATLGGLARPTRNG